MKKLVKGSRTPTTIAELSERLYDSTHLDIMFWDDTAQRYRIPPQLATHPTVGDLAGNQYIQNLRIESKHRWTGPEIGSGWNVRVKGEFDEHAFREGHRS